MLIFLVVLFVDLEFHNYISFDQNFVMYFKGFFNA